jgi:uncharacterized membrane protein
MFSRKFRVSSSSFCVGGLSSCLFLLPFYIYYHDLFPVVDSNSLFIIVLSSVFQAIYFYGVVNAYQNGNLSIAYPLLRSIPILMVLVYVSLFGDLSTISVEAIASGLLIILGCILLPMQYLKDLKLANYANKMIIFVLVAALGTAGYSVLDSIGMKMLTNASPDTNKFAVSFCYIYLQVLFTSLFLGVISISSVKTRKELAFVLKKQKLLSFTINAMTMLSYAPILVAMTLVTNVTYVVAFRQASIPIAFILGLMFLKEENYAIRWVAIGLIVTGLITNALY